jgi:NNP family nitrate/nitrite transporter-like MFS transporter
MTPMVQEFGISSAEAGLLMSAVVIPGIFLAIPVGVSVDRCGVRLMGFISTVLAAAGCLTTATANSFTMALIGRLILGVGGVFITTAMPAIIPQWFPREELGKAMGIYGINMPLATVIAFPVASTLMLAYNWRYPFYIGTAIAIVAIAIFTPIVKEGPLKLKEPKQRPSVRQALRNTEIWKVGIVWLLFNATALSFTTWAPKLFEDYKSMDPVYASFLASILMLAAMPCVPLYGWVSDKIGKRRLLMVVGSLLMSLALVASAHTSNLALVASIMVLGIAASMVPPTVFALTAEALGPSLAGISFGVTAICLNIGAALAPPIIGHLIDVTKSLTLSFMGMATFSATGAIAAYTLKTR